MNNIRVIVRGAYDVQKLRIQMGNRIVQNFKAKLGQKPSEKEDTMDKEAIALLADLRVRYEKLTDGVVGLPRQKTFKGDEVISTFTELCLIAQYFEIVEDEAMHFQRMNHILKEYPIFNKFLNKVKGIGPAMAGVLISEIDIEEAEYPSSLWKYAGLDVAPDGTARSRQKHHLVKVKYLDKKGNEQEKNSITFNPFLKTKLLGVLAGSLIRSGNKEYRTIYDNYKHRLDNMPAHKDKTKLHKHRMALRYMIKRFLVDLYKEWRTLEGLPVAEEYSVAKLGIIHKKA